jgi:hypothetical protein
MGYRRPVSNIIPERLAAWYLFKPRSFEITLENLAEIMDALGTSVHLGSSWNPTEKRKKVEDLIEYLNKIAKMKKKGLVAEPPPTEKEVGSA